MDPFAATAHYTPPGTLGPGGSAFTVAMAGVGGWLALLLTAAGLWRIASLRRRVARRAEEKAEERKLVPGYAVLHGSVETGDDLPAVSVRIYQEGREYRTKNGLRHMWREFERRVDVRPFHLRLASGERVQVLPDERVRLVDILGSAAEHQPPRGLAGPQRVETAELRSPDWAYVCGTLVAPSSAVVYRTMEEGFTLRPPRRGRMLVSTEPLEDRFALRARFHGFWLLGLLVATLFVNGVVFHRYWLELVAGRPIAASVTEATTWTTRGKHGPIAHYGISAIATIDGATVPFSSETNPTFYREAKRSAVGASVSVPFIVVPPSPGVTYDIGAQPTLNVGRLFIAWMFLAGVAGAYFWHTMHTRPWYERKTVVHHGRGPLGVRDKLI